MSTMGLFSRLSEISKEQFLEDWEKEDTASGHPDPSMDTRRREHFGHEDLRYYVATFSENGLEKLIVGYHIHPIDKPRVIQGGEPLWTVVSRYWNQVQSNQTDSCLSRLRKIAEELSDEFGKIDSGAEAEYSLGRVFNRHELAVPGVAYRDHGNDKVYAGNFHRFIGYGLWIKKQGYRPVKVYYCEKPIAP